MKRMPVAIASAVGEDTYLMMHGILKRFWEHRR
jgi:hypothetical protein